jgi:small subunit ribosomal protein S1
MKERISLGIKQLGKDAIGEAAASGELRKNAVVSAKVRVFFHPEG